MILRAEIAQRLFGSLLMIHPGKAVAALAAVGGRIVEGGVEIEGAFDPVHHIAFAGKVGDRLGRLYDAQGVSPVDVTDGGAAVIPVEGTLVHKGAYVGMASGRTSYQGLQVQVQRAMRDPKIRGAAFEIDSFGGEVAGAFETADMIADLSKAKPTMAILTDNALSAGYLMAAATRQIVMPEGGRVGSIGVITMHIDRSRQLEQEGVKVTIIASGKHKADGNPVEPLPAHVADSMQARVDAARQRFAEHVGRYRGRRFSAAQAMATEADDYGAADALRLGLVDAIGDSHKAFAAFLAAL